MKKDDNRRKFDISKYFYIIVAVFALIGGGLGFYGRVIAQTASHSGISTHNGKPEAHYEAAQAVEKRLDTHDLALVKIEGAVSRMEGLYTASQTRAEEKQREILDLLRNR